MFQSLTEEERESFLAEELWITEKFKVSDSNSDDVNIYKCFYRSPTSQTSYFCNMDQE